MASTAKVMMPGGVSLISFWLDSTKRYVSKYIYELEIMVKGKDTQSANSVCRFIQVKTPDWLRKCKSLTKLP